MTKEIFEKAIEGIKKQREKFIEIGKAYSIIFTGTKPENFIADAKILEDVIIDLVEKDSTKAGEGWTRFFIDELNFGESKIDLFDAKSERIMFKSANDLWAFLYSGTDKKTFK